jgi:hypothetical protein
MELLRQTVRALLIEDDAFRSNLTTMAQLLADDPYWSDIFSKPDNNRTFFKDLMKAAALRRNRITGILGAGAEGVAFSLDNGDVIKVGDLGHGQQPKGKESKYRAKLSKHRQKRATVHDIRLRDVGRSHAVMERLITFNSWLKTLEAGRARTIERVYLELSRSFGRALMKEWPHARIARSIRRLGQRLSTIDPIATRIADAFINEVDNSGLDLHRENLGVRIEAGGPTFVFYDF